jgi:pullulanase/glycogen debranching enzyme
LARAEKWTNWGFQPLHYFAPFHQRYLDHESALPLAELIERYTLQLT